MTSLSMLTLNLIVCMHACMSDALMHCWLYLHQDACQEYMQPLCGPH